MGLCSYLFFFAPGMGPMPWTINSEIYPMWARSFGNSLATSVNWAFNLIVSMTFLSLTEAITKQVIFGLQLTAEGTRSYLSFLFSDLIFCHKDVIPYHLFCLLPVLTYWAIFDRSLLHIFIQNQPKYGQTFGTSSKMVLFK